MSGVGEEVKRLRRAKGWTQEQLAVYAGSSQPTVNLLEAGKRNPSAATLEKLARALEVEVVDLFPKAPASSQPDFNGLLGEEQRRTELEEVRESFLEDCAPAGDYIMRWERWLDTGGIPEEAVREFLVAATALYPALLGLLRDELTAIVRVLGIKVVDELPDEAKAESAILPLVNRYWELGHKLTEVWNERFPEKENIVDLEAMRREPRLRRAG
jgi:transcriptional regulator with XRE-family HTH domain